MQQRMCLYKFKKYKYQLNLKSQNLPGMLMTLLFLRNLYCLLSVHHRILGTFFETFLDCNKYIVPRRSNSTLSMEL